MQDLIQRKADLAVKIIKNVKAISNEREYRPVSLDIGLKAFPSELNEKGEFIVLTGTKINPYGIGVETPPELVLIHNEKGGILIETSVIKQIIKDHRDSIEIVIDETYSIMGVKLNLGILSKYVTETFLDSLTVLR